MKTVNVRRDELLTAVKANLSKHLNEFEDARKEYKQLTLKEIEKGLDDLAQQYKDIVSGETCKPTAIKFEAELPTSHESDYKRAIEMLTMSVDETVELDEMEFSTLVMDQWEWKRRFELAMLSNKTALNRK